jgi:LysM repeat protein
MFSIAQSFGLTVDELAAANNIANPNFIDVGDVLIIPSPGGDTGDSGDTGDTGDTGDAEEPTGEQEYIIQPGDTLGKIAQRFGRTVEELVAYNNIDENTIIYAGETLLIPPSDWELPGDSGE